MDNQNSSTNNPIPVDTSQQNVSQTNIPQTQPVTPSDTVNIPKTTNPNPDQTNPSGQTQTEPVNSQQNENYVEEISGDLLSLFDEINSDDNFIQTIAKDMQIDTNKTKSILTTLLDKINKEQITLEELAFIVTATAADELVEEK